MTAPTTSFLTRSDPASVALDDYVRRHPQGSPYHLNAWRAAVEQAYGYPGLAVVAHGADGEVAGMLPLCAVSVPTQGTKWVSLPYCDLGGPLADSPAIAAALIEQARAVLGERAIGQLELRCSLAPGADEQTLVGRKVRMLLDLPGSAQEMMAGYPPKLRSQIRKAEKNGITFEHATHAGAVEEFYAVYVRNMHRLGSPPHSLQWFTAIHAHYAASGDIVIGLVRQGASVIGAGLVLRAGERAAIPWASTLAEFNHLAPNMLLYWGLQAYLVEWGVKAFDFGRSTMGEGTYRFKSQWGAAPCALDWQRWTTQGRQPEAAVQAGAKAGRLRTLVETAWKRLPLPVTTTVGPRLRRFITL